MKRILFADDDPLVARIYHDKLTRAGFEVVVAEDGVDAIKRFVQSAPDLVVLDLLMPKMNGADVIKFIRQHAELKATPVIVFSNSLLAALGEHVAAAGIIELSKSRATPGLLIELINQTLAAHPERSRDDNHSAATGSNSSASDSSSPPAPTPEKKMEFRTPAQQEFEEHLPRIVSEIHDLGRNLLEVTMATAEPKRMEELSQRLGILTHAASTAKFIELAQFSSALELLLQHLQEKKVPMPDSSRFTIATALAFLTQNTDRFGPAGAEGRPAREVLLVDDDAVTSHGLVQGLVLAKIRTTSVSDPLDALEHLRKTSFGLILLDVELPRINGMMLCEQLRRMDRHRRTPVIFITNHHDAKTHARTILCGGDDFISKPVLPVELTVRVTTLLLKAGAGW